MRIVVAITAASGAIYARQLLTALITAPQVDSIALICSTNAEAVVQTEGVTLPESQKIVRYDNHDLFASPASGSARWDSMVIVPASVGTLGRVASGVSQTLIERACDVMLKERRRLIVVVRETPLSLIHLRNMVTITEAGGIVLPAAPSFYSNPQDIEQLCNTVTERIVSLLGIDADRYEWQGK